MLSKGYSSRRMNIKMAICKLSNALTDALKHNEWVTGEVFAKIPILKIHKDLSFWAMVKPTASTIELHVNTGITATLEELWMQAWGSSILTLPDGQRIIAQSDDYAIEHMVHLSLVWLMLHELMHIQLSHFSIVRQASLVRISQSTGDDEVFLIFSNNSLNPITKKYANALNCRRTLKQQIYF